MVATWNVHGIRDNGNRGATFAYLRQLRADVVALQETHTPEDAHQRWTSEWNGPAAWTAHVGLLLRDGSRVTFASPPVAMLDGRVLAAELAGDTLPSSPLSLYCVYAPVDARERAEFIERLHATIRASPRTIILGDLNAAPLDVIDRWPPPATRRSEWAGYARLMEEHRLVDLVRQKDPDCRLWTWRSGDGRHRSRIDHILVSRRLSARCTRPETHPPPRSDHWPLTTFLESPSPRPQGRGPWRLNVSHLDDDTFVDIVDRRLIEFTEAAATGCGIDRVHAAWGVFKLAVRDEAIRYGREKHRRLEGAFPARLAELRGLHGAPPDPADAAATTTWLERVTTLEEAVTARVRGRLEARRIAAGARWTEGGERSTRYFFRRMRARQASRQLDAVRDEAGRVVTDIDDILGTARRFYEQLFAHTDTDPVSQDALLAHVTSRVGDRDSRALDSDITDDEVMRAIRTAPLASSPGPDGISFEFYKKMAARIAPVLTRLYNESRGAGRFPPSFCQTHVVLLPKAGDLLSLKNWRPISLSDCDIKILTRVLTSRMQRAASVCIHPSQTGFIKGRSIFDNIHAVHFALQCGAIKPDEFAGALLLLDQQKAYDRVDRAYLDRCLATFGIGPGFRRWLAMLGDGAHAAVRVGPSLSRWLPVRKGLRQGDPLSPLLYNFALEPLLCFLRARLAGLPLPGYALRTLAFADDVAVAVSSAEDVAVCRRGIRLHEGASAARLNDDKTVLIPVGRPSFALPGAPLRPREPTRYLGIMFTTDGLAADAMLARLENGIRTTAERWRDRHLSLVGRVLLTNTCLLSKLWFAAHIVPFPADFEKAVMTHVHRFLWNGGRHRLRADHVTRPKAEGGLGLLPLHEQALALFGTWPARALAGCDRPAWAPVAHWLLEHHLAALGVHPSGLCASQTLPPRMLSRLPAFWRRMLEFWTAAGGSCRPIDDGWHPLQLLSLPLVGTPATGTLFPSKASRDRAVKRWRQSGVHTIGDAIRWDEERRVYRTRDTAAVAGVLKAVAKGQLMLQEALLDRLRPLERAPCTGPPALPFGMLRLAGEEPDVYRPKMGRRFMHGTRPLVPRADRWHGVGETGDTAAAVATMQPWKAVFSSRIEPKHQSLLWLMQHGAVTTARLLTHARPGTSPLCPVCRGAIETLRHYFFDCPRVREYWRLVGAFLDRIQEPAATEPTPPPDLGDLLAGWPRRRKKLPGGGVLHALAVWQVYRAHAEASLDGEVASPIAMLARFQGEAMRRIRHDLINARRTNRPDRFEKTWTRVRCQWFVYDAGGDVSWRGRVVFDHAVLAPAPTTPANDDE